MEGENASKAKGRHEKIEKTILFIAMNSTTIQSIGIATNAILLI